jgi:hypothetical protein
MVVGTVTERVMGGLFEAPHTRLKSITIEYENGATLTLRDDILAVFATEIGAMWHLFTIMHQQAEQKQQQNQAPQQNMVVHGSIEQFRDHLKRTPRPGQVVKKGDDDDDKGE